MRDSTPLKSAGGGALYPGGGNTSATNKLKGGGAQGGGSANTVILSTDERKKLFNTFMKEMNQSLGIGSQFSVATKKVGGKKQGGGVVAASSHMNESIKYARGLSNPSSRPRSQLGATQTQTQNFTMGGTSQTANNYASLIATSSTQ
jgi:hypothetical protein